MITTDDLKSKIIEGLNLEDIDAEEIGDDDPLFGDEGLGLDSVDAIELTIFLDNEYGIRFANMADSQQAFASIRTLTEYVNAHAAPGASDDA